MGEASVPYNAVLFMGIMLQRSVPLDEVVRLLTDRYGPVDRIFGPVPFHHTGYYENEMGNDLQKTYCVFEKYIDREALSTIKNVTNGIEARYAINGKRTINLDPGYITRDKLILASTKDFYHRIYLSQGIFGEVTLHYRKGNFRFFSWTYPDYKEPGVLRLLELARARLVKTLRDE